MSVRLNPHGSDLLSNASRVAVAVSGGADSMALAHILRAAFPDKDLLAYTVDHGLRNGSADEAVKVAGWLSPTMSHTILTWGGTKPKTGIQEAARYARYDMLATACRRDKASILCTAHHRDDQAETILHRLAKGSGLDGLAGMRPTKDLHHVTLLRPLLHASHDDLVTYCRDNAIPWIKDPSNENSKFARVRLRQSRTVLEEEGLSNERLVRLGNRMSRARDALDFYTEKALQDYDGVTAAARRDLPAEIILRLVLKIADNRVPHHMLRSRLGQLEDLLEDQTVKRVTLGHTILTFCEGGSVDIEPEFNA